MKQSSSKSLTFALALIMAMTLLALPSCRSLEPTTAASATSVTSATTHTHDTVVLRDTVLTRDSIVLRERTIRDTVYITKEVYRDALNSKFKIQHSAKTDTVVVTEYRDRVVEHPPERYVPKFYKWCTGLLWGIIAIILFYLVLRITKPRLLMRF